MTSDALERLQKLLRELFQFDSAELDFGIYRIMNHKRDEVERFIGKRLPEIVDKALESGEVAQQAAQAEELQRVAGRIREDFGEYAISPQGELSESFQETPLGKRYLDLRSKVGEAGDREQLKVAIFNHLYTFFGRYYDNGDFISRRRYSKRQKYAIPYNGEEVYLHWANADQYYIKTGEHFFDYSYNAKGTTVCFKLVTADVEYNNVKGDKRYFIPRLEEVAFDEGARSLTIPFEWRPLADGEEESYGGSGNQMQKRINEDSAENGSVAFVVNSPYR